MPACDAPKIIGLIALALVTAKTLVHEFEDGVQYLLVVTALSTAWRDAVQRGGIVPSARES